jgi:hypothetical protein
MSNEPNEPNEKWKVETNDRYNKIVSSVITLATGALILPTLFLREFLAVPKEKALAPLLTCAAYIAWCCLGASILLGLLYSWISVKWIKQAWGQGIALSAKTLEAMMDWFFVLMMLLFVGGVAASVWFFVTVRAVS